MKQGKEFLFMLLALLMILSTFSTQKCTKANITALPWFSGYETGDYSEWDETRVGSGYRTLDNGTTIFVQNELKIVDTPTHHGQYASYHKSYGDFMNYQGVNTSIVFLAPSWPYVSLPSLSHVYVGWYQYFANVPNWTDYKIRHPDKDWALNVRTMALYANVGEIVRVYLKVPEWEPHPMLAHLYYWDGRLTQTATRFQFFPHIWYYFLYEFDATTGTHRLYISAPPYNVSTPIIELVGMNTTGVKVTGLTVGQFEADFYDAESYTDCITVAEKFIYVHIPRKLQC